MAMNSIMQLPSGWSLAALNDIIARDKAITYGIVQPGANQHDGVHMIRSQDYTNGWNGLDTIMKVHRSVDKPYERSRVRVNDLLLTVVGANVGRMAIVPSSLHGANISRSVARISIDSVKADLKYCFYALRYQQNNLVQGNQVGGAQPVINLRELSEFKIPLPPTKAEQTAIATALSDTDALITSLEKLIAKKRNIKQGALQELLKPKKGWNNCVFGDALERIIGGGTPSRSNPSYWGGEIPWVTVKDFATFHPITTQEYITREGLKNSASNLIPKNTLITSTRMALGKTVMYEVDVSINQDLKALFPKKDTDAVFIKYWFEHNQKVIESMGSGSTVMGLTLQELKRIPFAKPSLTEQKSIAQQLLDMDSELERVNVQLTKLKNIKTAMMQSLLTGKIRLV